MILNNSVQSVKPKKHLGQHFLTDVNIAFNITEALKLQPEKNVVLEIGPGMGVLTDFLLERKEIDLHVVDIDTESIAYLNQKYPQLKNKIHEADFLRMDLSVFGPELNIIGNFPYNISSQILFKLIEDRRMIPQLVGMFQKEVAERVASKHGNRTYGILSVFCQAFYHLEYLFTVNENVFNPPPKVKSGVIRLTRKENFTLPCDEKLFYKVVKAGFNQRRKTLRNSLRAAGYNISKVTEHTLTLRAEQLSPEAFYELTNQIQGA